MQSNKQETHTSFCGRSLQETLGSDRIPDKGTWPPLCHYPITADFVVLIHRSNCTRRRCKPMRLHLTLESHEWRVWKNCNLQCVGACTSRSHCKNCGQVIRAGYSFEFLRLVWIRLSTCILTPITNNMLFNISHSKYEHFLFNEKRVKFCLKGDPHQFYTTKSVYRSWELLRHVWKKVLQSLLWLQR